MREISVRITRAADLSGTFVFAVEGGLAGSLAGLDPVGVLVLAFLTALGGRLMRDVLIGSLPPAAVKDWHYSVIVLAATAAVWILHASILAIPDTLMIALDAAGLALAAIAGTEKALDHNVHPFVALFVGTVSGAGGGTLRDVLLNQVPRVRRTDIYALAAMTAAVVIVGARVLDVSPRLASVVAGWSCFALRLLAHHNGWHLPTIQGN